MAVLRPHTRGVAEGVAEGVCVVRRERDGATSPIFVVLCCHYFYERISHDRQPPPAHTFSYVLRSFFGDGFGGSGDDLAAPTTIW